MIDRQTLERAKAAYQQQEQQALADANAAHGAMAAIDALLKLFDEQEVVNDGRSNSNSN